MSEKQKADKSKGFNAKRFKAIWFSVLAFLIVVTLAVNIFAAVDPGGLTVFFDGAVTYEFTVVIELDEYPYERVFINTDPIVLAAEVEAFVGEFELDIDMNEFLVHFPSDFETAEEAFAHGRSIAYRIAEEGAILLKNEGGLPLPAGSRVSVFGNTAARPVYGGTGSGDIGDIVVPTITEVLRDIAGFVVNPVLEEWYYERRERRGDINMYGGGSTFWIGEVPVEVFPRSPHTHFNYEEYSDAAIIVFGRPGGEGDDLLRDMSARGARGMRHEHQLMLDYDEQNLVAHVTEHFDTVIVIINSSTHLQISELAENPDISAILWIGTPGYGIVSFGRIMNGEVNPSGRTVLTTARNMLANPIMYNFGHFSYTGDGLPGFHFIEYAEGIYVGYRYYETRFADDEEYWEHVLFPFGFGLSFTTFDWELVNTTHPEGADISPDDTISMTVRVTNTGDTAGMDVVQVYSSPPWTPGGIEKSRVNLVGFAKTPEIAPGASADVTIEIPVRWMASWDWNDANGNGFIGWELEAGTYYLTVQTDSRRLSSIEPIGVIVSEGYLIEYDEVTGTRIVPLFEDAALGLYQNLSRADWAGTWPVTHATREPSAEIVAAVRRAEAGMARTYGHIEMPVQGVPGDLTLAHMIGASHDDPRWEALLSQVTVEEMRYLIETAGYRTVSLDSVIKPSTINVDGPAALNVPMGFVEIIGGAGAGINFDGRTAFPSSSTLSSSWNVELAYEFGRAIGDEALHVTPTVSGWYAPGLNAHRSPFGGRLFEYFSEDPIHGGLIGAHVVLGIQSRGVTAYVKHFAINEQETNRENLLLTWVNEQAMREIYLRQFEIAVKIGGARGMMTAFNYVGPRWAGGCAALNTYLLRDEWGFNGAVITDFALGTTGGGYMNPDMAIRAGNDLILNPWSIAPMANPLSDTISATAVHFMRQATHNTLYATVNSNAMNGFANPDVLEAAMAAAAFPGTIGPTTQEALPPTWRGMLNAANIVLIVLIAAGICFVVVRLAKEGKK